MLSFNLMINKKGVLMAKCPDGSCRPHAASLATGPTLDMRTYVRIMDELEIGKTYAYTGWIESQRGGKALVLRRVLDSLYRIRWPNGMETEVSPSHFTGPVDPAKPGIDEPCLRCHGHKDVEITRPNSERPWVIEVVGTEPCPNCARPPQ